MFKKQTTAMVVEMIQRSKQVQELNSYYFFCSQIFINIYPGCIIEEKFTYTGNNINIGGREKWQGTKVSLCQAEFILTPSSSSSLLRSSSLSIEVKPLGGKSRRLCSTEFLGVQHLLLDLPSLQKFVLGQDL